MRREYDYEYTSTELDTLMNAININKAKFGGSDMYIELARKFDNSAYQWVIYRNNIINHLWDTQASGYFVLFNKSGTVIKSLQFSNLYLGQGLSQTCVTGLGGTTIKDRIFYYNTLLFVPVAASSHQNFTLRTYGVGIYQKLGYTPIYTDITLRNTSANIGNYSNCNPYIYSSGTSIYWCNSAAISGWQRAICVTVTLSSTKTTSPTIETTVDNTKTASQNYRCQLLYYGSFARFVTWIPNASGWDIAKSIGYTGYSSVTGLTPATTAVSPFVGRYHACFYLPIWSWANNTTTYPSADQYNKSLWWLTNDSEDNSYIERKFMLADELKSLTPTSTAENQSYYRIANGRESNNYPLSYGLMTTDGITVITMNINTRLLEKLNTQIR